MRAVCMTLLPVFAMLVQQFINGGYTVLTQIALKGGIEAELFALIRDSVCTIAISMLLLAAHCLTRCCLLLATTRGLAAARGRPRCCWPLLAAAGRCWLLATAACPLPTWSLLPAGCC